MIAVPERMSAAVRISALRERCFERKTCTRYQDSVVRASSLQRSAELGSWQRRMGRLSHDRLAGLTVAVDDLELLVGRIGGDDFTHSQEELAAAKAVLDSYQWPGGQTGHCELDLSSLYERGIDGLRADLVSRLANASGPAVDAYQSFIDAVDGLALLIEHAAEAADAARPDASLARQAELEEMAAICRRVAHLPPCTFREALQLMWLTVAGVQAADNVGLVGPGHIDRTFRSFYDRDIEAGILTPDQALLYLECLYILINENIPDGLAVPVMVGGRDAQGQDVTHPLSFLCLEALRRTRMVYPTVGVCWHERTPSELMRLAVDLVSEGYATPAFFGDETIQRGLRELGVPAWESCNYINSTCVEITPVGASNVWVASPYFPLCKILLEEIQHQVEEDAAAPDFEAFLSSYRQRLGAAVAEAVTVQNALRQRRQTFGGKPLQSVFTRDCVDRGHDIDDGGARYNWVECSFVGLANLADSLTVIRHEIYEQGRLTLGRLKGILDADFADCEVVRQRFMKAYPKYGNGEPEVDDLVASIMATCRSECAKHRMYPYESAFVPGTFCWVMHERLGRESGATPDGRRAGFPFADGCGPAQGRETCGPTAAILSTTSWDHAPMIGGAAYNMKFNTSLFKGTDATRRLEELILTFLRRGGFETQVNVIDHETLRKARETPEDYRDLVVRIGGYTDYFTRLSPEMQEEVMLRDRVHSTVRGMKPE